jgi:hypothetical protein
MCGGPDSNLTATDIASKISGIGERVADDVVNSAIVQKSSYVL